MREILEILNFFQIPRRNQRGETIWRSAHLPRHLLNAPVYEFDKGCEQRTDSIVTLAFLHDLAASDEFREWVRGRVPFAGSLLENLDVGLKRAIRHGCDKRANPTSEHLVCSAVTGLC